MRRYRRGGMLGRAGVLTACPRAPPIVTRWPLAVTALKYPLLNHLALVRCIDHRQTGRYVGFAGSRTPADNDTQVSSCSSVSD